MLYEVITLGVGIAMAGVAVDSAAALAGALLAVVVVWGLTHLRPAFSTMVLLGAHYDHLGHGDQGNSLADESEAGKVHRGADDNASGVRNNFV